MCHPEGSQPHGEGCHLEQTGGSRAAKGGGKGNDDPMAGCASAREVAPTGGPAATQSDIAVEAAEEVTVLPRHVPALQSPANGEAQNAYCAGGEQPSVPGVPRVFTIECDWIQDRQAECTAERTPAPVALRIPGQFQRRARTQRIREIRCPGVGPAVLSAAAPADIPASRLPGESCRTSRLGRFRPAPP